MNGVKEVQLVSGGEQPAQTETAIDKAPKKELAFGTGPATFEEAWRMASAMARSTMVPKDFIGQPENVLVAMQMGAELGLSPMQSLQSIAVINGRPSLWGDAMLALVIASGKYENHDETLDETTMTAVASFQRKGKTTPIVRSFSQADARTAGLWGKTGPWSNYPKRMLQMRARALALRDGFPDVLKGLSVAEEAIDVPTAVVETVQPKAAVTSPDGFDEWTIDLKACAEEGLDKLTAAWEASSADYRKHLGAVDPTAWDRLKVLAAERSKRESEGA